MHDAVPDAVEAGLAADMRGEPLMNRGDCRGA
jgi:hypothetical protein